MPNKQQSSFTGRVAQMREVAQQLDAITEIVTAEAMSMAAAEKRFSERRGGKEQRRAR